MGRHTEESGGAAEAFLGGFVVVLWWFLQVYGGFGDFWWCFRCFVFSFCYVSLGYFGLCFVGLGRGVLERF